MTYPEVLAAARGCIGPYCKACPVCNGLACKNTVPGPGAKGLGTGAIRNYQKWQELCVNMDTICENKPVDTSFALFGQTVDLPVFAAPVGAMQLHYGDKYDDLAYNDILVAACAQAGIAAFTGDGTNPAVMEAAACLPDGVDFIGCHPMAGKEVSGIGNAEGTLFRNTHFIVTPGPKATAEHLALLHRMAEHCRFGDVIETTPERHDEMIAYTSQLMHVIAVSVCDNDELFSCKGFEGGSFRDCTRVAALDAAMWTQLFTFNAPALAKVVGTLENRMRQYREAIEAGDQDALRAMLAQASDRKKQINLERARGDDVRPGF